MAVIPGERGNPRPMPDSASSREVPKRDAPPGGVGGASGVAPDEMGNLRHHPFQARDAHSASIRPLFPAGRRPNPYGRHILHPEDGLSHEFVI